MNASKQPNWALGDKHAVLRVKPCAGDRFYIMDGFELIAICDEEASAKELVRCVNEHAALVAVAEAAEATLGMCDHVSALNGGGKNSAGEAMRKALDALDAVRAGSEVAK